MIVKEVANYTSCVEWKCLAKWLSYSYILDVSFAYWKKVVQENYVLDAYACCKCDRSATEEVVGYRLELLGYPGY